MFLLFVLGKWSIDFWLLLFFNESCEKNSAHPMSSFPSCGGLGGLWCSDGEYCLMGAVPPGWSFFSSPPRLTFAETPWHSLSVRENAWFSPMFQWGRVSSELFSWKDLLNSVSGWLYYFFFLTCWVATPSPAQVDEVQINTPCCFSSSERCRESSSGVWGVFIWQSTWTLYYDRSAGGTGVWVGEGRMVKSVPPRPVQLPKPPG